MARVGFIGLGSDGCADGAGTSPGAATRSPVYKPHGRARRALGA
jgi:hypothetical protein